jgi:hypothetical protein
VAISVYAGHRRRARAHTTRRNPSQGCNRTRSRIRMRGYRQKMPLFLPQTGADPLSTLALVQSAAS